MKNTGYVAIGTFKLSREQIELLSSASALDAAFDQFGAATNFNSLENGAFQGSASGDPAELYDGVNSFAGSKVYIVIGNGSDLRTSSEFLVWDSGLLFDGTGPTGGPWEAILSVDSGDLIIGLSDKNTSDFSLIGGDAERGAFTTVMIDEALDDHGNSQESATFITENSTTSGKIDDGADIDYFRVDLSEDGNLFVKINQNLDLKLYDGEGVLIEAVQDAGDGLGGGVAADFMISKDLAAGTYYVSVAGDENTSDVGYNLESEFEVKIIDLDPESAGSYYGLVTNKNDKPVGRLTITITPEGAYSGKLDGINRSKRYFKGYVQPDYNASAPTKDVFGKLSVIDLSIARVDSGLFRISGQFHPLTDSEPSNFFSLRKSIYDITNPPPSRLRGRYTMLIPSSSTTIRSQPAGDGLANGSLFRAGKLKLYGYSNSGAKFSYSCPILEGDQTTFYTRPKGGLEAMVGNVIFSDEAATDFRGEIRYRRKRSSNAYYDDFYLKNTSLEGSKYKKPSSGELSLNNFNLVEDNAIAKFSGSGFGGVDCTLTWTADGDMLTNSTLTYSASALLNKKTGRFAGEFIVPVNTEGNDTLNVVTYLRGVVLQKQGRISGQAVSIDGPVDRYTITPSE